MMKCIVFLVFMFMLMLVGILFGLLVIVCVVDVVDDKGEFLFMVNVIVSGIGCDVSCVCLVGVVGFDDVLLIDMLVLVVVVIVVQMQDQ